MSEFLRRMAAHSAERAAAARRDESEVMLHRRALDTAPAPSLVLHPEGFDLVAEIKRRSPSAGDLAAEGSIDPARRAQDYAAAGAAAISVLTEPSEFGGSLFDLETAAGAVGVPVLRKDFLVDPYQMLESRASGAAGVLLILRLLDDARLDEMLQSASEMGLFVLLEAFDEDDLRRSTRTVELAAARELQLLLGLNCRDLATLETDPARFEQLCASFPPSAVRVAESGVEQPGDAAEVAALGYRVALVGSALMCAPDPAALASTMVRSGREAARQACG